MKDLLVPIKQENTISIGEITSEFNGLIIAYSNDNPVGYIQYYDDWAFLQDIDSENIIVHDNSLFILVQDLIQEFNITNFKVIEFKND